MRDTPDDPDPQVRTLGIGNWVRLEARGRWEYAVRVRGTRAVMIAALTPEGELLLVEQPRAALNTTTLELPAGLVGDDRAGEDPALAAARELEEETGYRAGRLVEVAEGCSSAGITDERVTAYVGLDLTRVGPGGGVAGEDITVHRVPLPEVEDWIAREVAQGKVVDLKVYAGLHWLRRMLGTADPT